MSNIQKIVKNKKYVAMLPILLETLKNNINLPYSFNIVPILLT
jgi:hypothetical protein